MNGERNTEVCIIELIKELDAGPIYKKEAVEIYDQENFGTLSERLGAIGARLVKDTILEILDMDLKPKPQENTETTYASKIKKEDTIIDWNWSADKITNLVRSLSPQPVAKTTFNNKNCKIISCIQANSADIATDNIKIGKLYKDKINKNLFVGCGNKELVSINELQIEGKNSVKAAEFLNGLQDITKAYFT
jgi:methionyl-tRNA formyltransferase